MKRPNESLELRFAGRSKGGFEVLRETGSGVIHLMVTDDNELLCMMIDYAARSRHRMLTIISDVDMARFIARCEAAAQETDLLKTAWLRMKDERVIADFRKVKL